MGMMVRKRPCPCGSGRAARSCCGRFSRVSEADAASAYLARQARHARDIVGPFSPVALAALQAEAALLPETCEQFTAALLVAREPVTAAVRKLARSLRDDHAVRLLPMVIRQADTPAARVAVAKAVAALREAGLVDEHVAAAALVELAGGSSPLTEAALVHAATTIAGLDRSEVAVATWATTRAATA